MSQSGQPIAQRSNTIPISEITLSVSLAPHPTLENTIQKVHIPFFFLKKKTTFLQERKKEKKKETPYSNNL